MAVAVNVCAENDALCGIAGADVAARLCVHDACIIVLSSLYYDHAPQ
jgi:hypothetical protein